ncbi:MAG: hypothetical protein Q4G45_05775 [Actinomycetia bacterium]|nr:hypothetical protein [Actinomycetes bacterium]
MSHVLLIDDTWTSGATMMSAVLAVRRVGADRVSTLVLARWLNPRKFGKTRELIKRIHKNGDWESPQKVCPFTADGDCPA